MAELDDLYSELKPDILALSTPLFEISEECLKKRGNFLPHGAVLTMAGTIELIAGLPDVEGDIANSTQVLPVLHDGLRQHAKNTSLLAIAIAENVTITPTGEPPTEAIKVLIEHKRGLTIAVYQPFKKKFLRSYSFGNTFVVPAKPEIDAWS